MPQYLEFASNHYLLVFALFAVIFLLIQDLIAHSFNRFENVSAQLAVTRMNTDDTIVVDVREPHEYVKGHIEGAMNIPLAKLDEQIASLEQYKAKTLLVVCQSGSRSIPACKTLSKAGFDKVINLDGGMQSWEDTKLPVKITAKNKD